MQFSDERFFDLVSPARNPAQNYKRTWRVALSARGRSWVCRQQFIQARLPPVGCVLMDDAAFGCFIERRDERADVFGI
jgi:hypothetical protein